jgi:hypothetical protein
MRETRSRTLRSSCQYTRLRKDVKHFENENFLTHPVGGILEMQRAVAKNAYGCNAIASRPGARTSKNPGRKLRRPATVMQKPCTQGLEFVTQRDANIGAPATAALVL